MNDVFISYSHQDKAYLEKLKRHFRPFRNKINFWDDSKILPGQEWKKEIIDALTKSKVAILLLSADFFNSEFIQDEELPKLLSSAEKDGCLILSVILKPCFFDEYPEINKYQAINSPNYTIIQMSEHEQEQTWIALLARIRNILFT
jgi:hypothetical protein